MTLLKDPVRAASMLATAMMATMVLFTASAGQARTSTVVYTAELQAPVKASKYIIKGTVIHCDGTNCKGAKSPSSAKNVCAKLSHKAGPLTSFSYKGEAFDEAALAKCND